ncbi:N-acetyltransferase ESCO2 [Microcaecilia unicolor]|uniref:N-acetyltransferase ESCO2 n=1 Tax=Microcaecilia unicolor TaxID=1415580 RepID=A0A6P7XN31_9AMPH|nr:N-acetyltransferase ESCO2 [Microcaecilia unicolor]
MMTVTTPRKRKQSSLSPDSFPASGAPVKKIVMDFSASASPLSTRAASYHSLSLQAKLEAKNSKAEKSSRLELEAEKENLNFSLLEELVNSPLQMATAPKTVYSLSLLNKSPELDSPCNPAVPAESFYSKGKVYFTPLDRKLLKQSRSLKMINESGHMPCIGKTEKRKGRKSILKNPVSKHQVVSRQARPVPRNAKKVASSMLPARISVVSQLSNSIAKTQANGPFRVLSLKTKPKPKLLVGAAFFVTGKKSHTVFRKPTQVTKPVQSASRPMVKEELQKGAGIRTASTTNERRPGGAKGIELTKSTNVPKKKHIEIKEKFHGERQKEGFPKEREKFCLREVKICLQKIEKPHVIQASVLEDQTSSIAVDTEILGTVPSLHYVTDEDEVTVPCTGAAQEKRVSPLETAMYPMFNTPCTNKKRHQDFQEQLASPPLGSSTPSALASTGQLGPQPNKRKRESKDQLVIDAGQKHFGAITCRSCGMIYTAASPEDEAQHMQYHQRFMEGIKFVGWKKEHIVAKFWDGKIIMIQPDDPKYAIKKAEEVRELVDNELGFKQTTLSCPNKTVTYLYVSNEKKIVGCLIAEQIKQAFQVLPESVSHDLQSLEMLDRHRAWRCSTVPQTAICGISRVWVFSLMRRRGIASRMVDAVRTTFTYGSYLSTDDLAFSDPTPDGKLFATKYCKVPSFLVYNFVG